MAIYLIACIWKKVDYKGDGEMDISRGSGASYLGPPGHFAIAPRPEPKVSGLITSYRVLYEI